MKHTLHTMQVQPGYGRLVRHPPGSARAGQAIQPGDRVRLDSYIARRLACGDLEPFQATAPEPVKARKNTPSTAKADDKKEG